MLSKLFNRSALPSLPDGPQAAQLTLRLKHQNFLRALQANGVPESQMPLTRPLCGELLVSYAFETPEQFLMATPDLLKQAGIAPKDAPNLALHNLHKQVLGYGMRLVEDNGAYLLRIARADTITRLEACSLLLDGTWELLREEIKPDGELLACVPTRDLLFVFDSAKPETHGQAMALAKELFDAEETHALSLQIMVQRAAGWQLWQTT